MPKTTSPRCIVCRAEIVSASDVGHPDCLRGRAMRPSRRVPNVPLLRRAFALVGALRTLRGVA